jgi:iron complex transport system substrate-binding protein
MGFFQPYRNEEGVRTMKWWKQLAALMLMLLLVLSGCNQEESTPTNEVTSEETQSLPVVTDALGNEVQLDKQPERIVSLIPSNTEILYAIGLGDAVVGVTDWDNYPEDVLNKEKVGGMEFDVEKILSLEPDLVLDHGSRNHQEDTLVKQLQDAGVPVFVVPEAKSIQGIFDTIVQVGNLTGQQEQAETVVSDLTNRLNQLKDQVAQMDNGEPKVVWIEISPQPELYSAGKGTYIDEAIEMLGAKNAVEQEGWPLITEEAAISYNPDVIITTYGYYVDNAIEQVLSREGWQDVKAVKNKAVYDVQSDLLSRPGPRIIEGVEELAKAIYPDQFK